MASSLSMVPPVWPSAPPATMGTRRPAAAAIGATRRDVLSPTPPVECLSAVRLLGRRMSSLAPEWHKERVSALTSASSIPRRNVAIRKALSCASSMDLSAAPRTTWAISSAVRAWPSRLRRIMLRVSRLGLFGMGKIEAEGQQLGQCAVFAYAVSGKQYRSGGLHEFGEHLAACAAGRAGGVVEICYSSGCESDARAMLGDG